MLFREINLLWESHETQIPSVGRMQSLSVLKQVMRMDQLGFLKG
jgi:hypothetical protein